jgi:hypothetical protein
MRNLTIVRERPDAADAVRTSRRFRRKSDPVGIFYEKRISTGA